MCLQSVLFQLQQHLFDKNGLLLISKMLQISLYFAGPCFTEGFKGCVSFLPYPSKFLVCIFLKTEI